MANAFSVASWNVEHFKSQGVSSRVEDVVEFRDIVATQELRNLEQGRGGGG
jgi:hypothetical protein